MEAKTGSGGGKRRVRKGQFLCEGPGPICSMPEAKQRKTRMDEMTMMKILPITASF